jgi:hypothetical protein
MKGSLPFFIHHSSLIIPRFVTVRLSRVRRALAPPFVLKRNGARGRARAKSRRREVERSLPNPG